MVRNNQIRGKMAAGIYLNSISDQDIYGNTIEDNVSERRDGCPFRTCCAEAH